MISILKKIFGGTKHDKDVQSLKPIVLQINEEYARLSSLSDEQLKSKTHEFKALIQSRTATLQEELAELREQLIEACVAQPEATVRIDAPDAGARLALELLVRDDEHARVRGRWR